MDPYFFIAELIDADSDTQLGITERVLHADPDNIDAWESYEIPGTMYDELPRCVAFVKTEMNDEFNLELHRYYQNLTEALVSETAFADLVREYDSRLADDADNPDLIYLRDRLEKTVSSSAEYMYRTLEKDPEHVHAMMALAYEKNSVGEHTEAVELLTRARELDPDNEDLRELCQSALLAARDFEKFEAEMKRAPSSYLELINQMNYLVKSKQVKQLKLLRQRYIGEAGEDGGLLFDVHDRYLVKKFDEMEELSREIPIPQYGDLIQFSVAIETGDLDQAKETFGELELDYADYELLLAIALHHQGKTAESEKVRAEFVEKSLQKGSTERAFAELFRGCETRAIGVEELRELSVDPRRKRVYAIALREFSTEAIPGLDEEVRMLNYDYTFPCHFINSRLKPEEEATASK